MQRRSPVLEMLLEAAARDERAATERTAERVSIQLARIRDEPEPPVQAATPSPPEREPKEPEESDEAVSDDADKPDGAAAVRGTPKPVGPGPVGVFDPNKPIATHDDELAGVGGSDLGRRVSGASRASPTDAADARGFEPRVPSRRPAFAPDAEHHGVLIEDDEGGRKSRGWMWGAAATVVVLGGVGLVFSGVMPIGGSESQTASLPVPPARPALPPADNDSAVAPPGAAADTVPSLEGGQDTLVAALGDTGLSVCDGGYGSAANPCCDPGFTGSARAGRGPCEVAGQPSPTTGCCAGERRSDASYTPIGPDAGGRWRPNHHGGWTRGRSCESGGWRQLPSRPDSRFGRAAYAVGWAV